MTQTPNINPMPSDLVACQTLIKKQPGMINKQTGVLNEKTCLVETQSNTINELYGKSQSLELQIEKLGEGLDHQRLRQPGHTDDENVAASNEAQHEFPDRLILADDSVAQAFLQQGHTARHIPE